jgi:aspartyl-tRNA(Asn)/glutamyl-tRNA(Gln) amidotransferase subunit A
MAELADLGAAALAAAIHAREASAEEVARALAARIEDRDAALNAVVARRLDEAVAEARAADAALAAGQPPGPLHGVPVTVKEAIAVAGMPLTNGSRLYGDRRADGDAASVRRLRAAGAIVLGVTNVPEFCAWYDTDNDVYGRTANPHDHARSPGGSSGGESAAAAACLSPLGLGSDIGSSIRQPAAWTGVLGLKPSRGLVPADGHADFGDPQGDAGFGEPVGLVRFATVGPLARAVADLELALPVLAGHALPAPAAGPLRVAVYEEDGLQPVARACRAAVRRAAAALADAGHTVVDAVPPNLAETRRIYEHLLVTELRTLAWPTVAGRQDELSDYGRRAFADIDQFTPDLGAYRASGVRLDELEAAADAWHAEHPIALCPVVPVPAPVASAGLVDVEGEPFRPGGKLTLCTYANTFGLPAVSVPCGRDRDGLPLAVQVLGRRGADADVLAVARTLESALGGAVTPAV